MFWDAASQENDECFFSSEGSLAIISGNPLHFASAFLCAAFFKSLDFLLSAAQHGFTQEDNATHNTLKSRHIECYSTVYLLKQMVKKNG